MSIGFTSPPPKVRDSPYWVGSLKVVMPKLVAKLIKLFNPFNASTFTAGILYEFPNANRVCVSP
jgi:hypothetical protein